MASLLDSVLALIDKAANMLDGVKLSNDERMEVRRRMNLVLDKVLGQFDNSVSVQVALVDEDPEPTIYRMIVDANKQQ